MGLALLAFALGLGGPAAQASDLSGMAPRESVVLLQQGSTSCAGALVGSGGEIATAYHCVADGGRVRVQTHDGRVASAMVVSRWPSRDLAILRADALAGPTFLKIRETAITPGERVRAWGHPFGAQRPGGYLAGTLRWSVSEGVVSAVGARAIQTTAPVNPGNSGGPLVDADGLLVGVVSRRLRGDGMGFATRASQVATLLADPKRGPVVGGSVRGSLLASLWDGPGGSAAGGVGLELAARDRVVVRGQLQWAPRPHFDALRFGSTSWNAAEAHLGFRQRLGFGYWTARFEAYGGLSVVQTVSRAGVVDDVVTFNTSVGQTVRPVVGGRLTLGLAGVDVGAVPLAGGEWALRTSLVVQWPGRLGVF